MHPRAAPLERQGEGKFANKEKREHGTVKVWVLIYDREVHLV